MKLRIGSRGSKLAVTQAEWVAKELLAKNPILDITFSRIATQGDRNSDGHAPSFAQSKGVFVKEIEEALLKKEIDLAVHSMKDLPQELPSGLLLGPTPVREDPRDVLISRFGEQLNELPRHSVIGTSSPRRQAQIVHKYKKRGYDIRPIRGNVDTRIKKLQSGEYDAIILALAGLNRLGLEPEATQILEPDEMLPAACQGCLALEYRESDSHVLEWLYSIKDNDADVSARAERSFLQGLGGNCDVPVGVSTTIVRNNVQMKAILLDPKGERAVRADQTGDSGNPELMGAQLAERLLYNGGSELMFDLIQKKS